MLKIFINKKITNNRFNSFFFFTDLIAIQYMFKSVNFIIKNNIFKKYIKIKLLIVLLFKKKIEA